MERKIPLITLQRLPVYLNYLIDLPIKKKYISSGHIAADLGLGEVLVRKDLAFTSAVGRPRVGYVKQELVEAIQDALCYNGRRNAIIVGYGALGKAIMGYNGFGSYGIEIVAAFDSDAEKLGSEASGKPIYDIKDASTVIPRLNTSLAIICVPASAAQRVCDVLVKSGIKAILNFAPTNLKTPPEVEVRHIDVAANLAILSTGIE